jgi:hypothetical protein
MRFLRLLRDTGSFRVSAEAIGFTTATMKKLRERDTEFDELCHEAEDDAADALEQEARRRAVNGVKRKKVLGFKDDFEIITERHYSDTLLIRLLEANNPAKFTNRSKTEITNPDGSLAPQIGDTELAAKLSSLLAIAEARMKAEGTDNA